VKKSREAEGGLWGGAEQTNYKEVSGGKKVERVKRLEGLLMNKLEALAGPKHWGELLTILNPKHKKGGDFKREKVNRRKCRGFNQA